MRAFLALLRALGARDRRRLALIAAGLALAALFEVVGVASVIPFLTLVGDPAAAYRVPALLRLRETLGLGEDRSFLLLTGFAALAAILLTSVVNALLTYAQLRFTHLAGYRLSRRLFARYLDRDRLFFAQANSAELAKNVLAETDRLVTGVLTPACTLFARALAAGAIIVFLVLYEPRLALLLGAGFGGLYVALYALMRRRLAAIGTTATADNEQRFRIVAESFGALTELKLYGREKTFAASYDRPAAAYARANALSLIIGQMPRYAVEALAFGGIVAVVLFALAQGRETGSLLPLLGLFAFAGYRVLPAFQAMFLAFSTLRYYLPAVGIVVDGLEGERAPTARATERLPFERELRLEAVSFSYGGRRTLEAVDLVVPARSTVGFVGRTGAGKTTLVGLVLGILVPEEGRITVDGVPLSASTLGAWQNRIGYVPQDVFLIDADVTANIALGVPAAEVDHAAVARAARLAAVEGVVAALPQGFATRLGERGARLSGGQRQRIGIARALYHDPDVIVFDEATSALDGETEAAVMGAIDALAGTRTVLMIAHRLSSLERADTVHVLEAGRLVASGRLSEVAPRLGAAA